MRIYPELLVDQEFQTLGDQGFSGTLNDRQFAFLRSKGYVNALADMMTSWLAFSFTPSSLFAASEPGIWLDPSDLTTMFQDRAGTIPVTTPGQSVGYRRDKSGRNNHAVANSDAARGIYGIEPVGGRRNLLINTTTMATQNATVTAVAHTLSFTGTGTVTLSGTSTAGPLVGTGANDRVSLTFTPTAGTLTLTVSGSVTLAQLQIGPAFDAYQRVGTTQYDVTEAGKQTLHYVQYDGSDDGYVTPTISPNLATSDGAARRNLLLYPSMFDDAAWTKLRLNVTANATPSPDGTTTADHLIDTAVSGTHVAIQLLTKAASAITYTASVYLKASARTKAEFRMSDQAGNGVRAAVDLSDGSVGAAVGFGTGFTSASAAIQAVGNGWHRVTLAATSNSATSIGHEVYVCDASGNTSYTGDGASGIFAWGAQLELGTTATAFQNIGTDKVQVFAGVRKLSDAARAMLVELGNNVAQSVRFEAPNTTGSVYYSFSSVGSSSGFAGDTNAARAAPNTSVLTGLGDISADRSTLRVNGSQAAQATTDQGTGNYLAYPLYIGRRGGTTLPFNGRDYGLVVRFGANLDASTIAATESYMAQKTGVTL